MATIATQNSDDTYIPLQYKLLTIYYIPDTPETNKILNYINSHSFSVDFYLVDVTKSLDRIPMNILTDRLTLRDECETFMGAKPIMTRLKRYQKISRCQDWCNWLCCRG